MAAGARRLDAAVQVLDKEGQMREGQPMEQQPVDQDKAFSDKCVILLIRLVAQLRLVHRSPEYLRVWGHWQQEHGPYSGPTYTKEYIEAREHVEMKFDQPADGLGPMVTDTDESLKE